MIGQMISLAFALLGAAAVYGTDVFFCVVGRTALAQVSDAALVETMGRLHEVADRRMPLFRRHRHRRGTREHRFLEGLVALGTERSRSAGPLDCGLPEGSGAGER
jgi:hypothetical protein